MADTPEQPQAPRNLKSLVRDEIDSLTAQAVSQGVLSEQTLHRLGQLTELEKSLPEEPVAASHPWRLIALALLMLLVPGLLISLKVSTVELQVSLLVSELSWQQRQAGDILDYLKLESVNVRAFDRIEIPQTRQTPADTLTEPQAYFWVPEGHPGQISLDPLHVGDGTSVSMSRSDDEHVLGVSLGDASQLVHLNLSGTVGIAAGGRPHSERDFGRSRPLRVAAVAPNMLDLSMRIAADQRVTFPPHITVTRLSLQQVREVLVEGSRTPRSVSTLIEGEIFNESLNGRQYKLRNGEWLSLQGVDGEIRSMTLTPQGFALDFHGTVSDVRVGSSSTQRSLMPSWLEWIAERHSVKLLWGAFLWLLTTAFGVIKWWNREN